MTSLAPTPLYVSLVQSATLLPVFCFALAAGALADIIDRRRLLLVVQSLMAVVALVLGVLVWLGAIGPWSLLAFSFAIGTGAAFSGPAWQAVVPHLVPRSQLHAAIALNSAGFNMARALGPAIAGVLIGGIGIAAPFFCNAISFLAVIGAFLWWRRTTPIASHLPSERLTAAMRAGLRYARESPALRATLIRSVAFFVFGVAYWALLPLVVRVGLGAGPEAFGLVLAAVGVGAVAGAVLLGWLRQFLDADRLVALGTIGTVLALVAFAFVSSLPAAAAAGVLAGTAWILVVPSLNVSAQLALPEWMRGRGLALFQMSMFGGMGGGSAVWGRLAEAVGTAETLLIAAVGAVIAMLATWRWSLKPGADADLNPGAPWPEPQVAAPVCHDRGPVLVTIEYRIDSAERRAFLAAMQALRGSRRRGGAYAWGVFEDAAAPDRYLECFVVESWLDHLRQHDRVTASDRAAQDAVLRFHRGQARPPVVHWLGLPGDAPPPG